MQTPLLSVENQFSQPTTHAIVLDILEKVWPIFLVDLTTALDDFFNASIVSSFSPKEDFSAAAAIIFTTQAAYIVVPSAFLYTISFTIPYHENKKMVVTNSIALALLVGFPVSILAYFTGNIFSYIGTPNSVCNIVDEYYSVFAFALPLMIMAISLHQAAIGLDKKKWLYISGLINLVSTLGTSFLFTKIYPLNFLSKIKTVAFSFLFGSGIMRFAFYGAVFAHEGLLEKPRFLILTTHKENFLDMFKKGYQICIQVFSELSALNILAFLTECFLPNKVENLNILNAMNQYFFFSIIVPYALGQAASTRIGEFCAAKKYDQVQTYGNYVLAVSTVYNFMYVILGLAIPKLLASLFLDPGENNNAGMSGNFRAMFTMIFLGLLLNSYREILGMILRPMGIFKPQKAASIAALWFVGIPSAIAFAKLTDLGVAGVLMGYYLGVSVGSIYLLNLWFSSSSPETVKKICENEEDRKKANYIFHWPKDCKSSMYQDANERNENDTQRLFENAV